MRVGLSLSLGVLARANRALFPSALGDETVLYWLPVSGADTILVSPRGKEAPDQFLVCFPPACDLTV
jgi:hypothetical protein